MQLDINECERLLPCGLTGIAKICTNTDGGYMCSCPLGFEPLLEFTDAICKGTRLEYIYVFIRNKLMYVSDINECPDACNDDENSICINTIGSYHCLCPLGFHKNNSVCEGSYISIMMGTMKLIFQSDNNECEIINCGLHAECTNTVGSFKCDCAAGYVGLPPLCLGKNIRST